MNPVRRYWRIVTNGDGGEWTMRNHCTNLVDSCECYLNYYYTRKE